MKMFNKISSIVLAFCMAISLFAVPSYATTPEVDVKNAISFGGEITKVNGELQVNFAIPEGLSDIRGVQFYVEMPAGFAVDSVSTTLNGWQAYTGALNIIVLECGEGYQSLEELFPAQATNSYKVATLGITVDKDTCGENGPKIAKVTVQDVTAGEEPVSNDGNTSVDRPFTLNITECSHTGGTATCVDKAVCSTCSEPYGEINANNHKTLVPIPAVAASCTKTGLTAGQKCTACNKVTKAQTVVAKTAHKYGANYVSQKATTSKDGAISKKCSVCSGVVKVSTVYKAKTVKLAYTSKSYTGKSLKPKVTVKDSAGKTISSSNYSVKYSNNKKVGKATVKVTFKGNYSGTKTLTFKIVPKKTSISSLKAGKKSFTVKYKKQTSGTGYEIQYSTSKSFKGAKTAKISKNKTVSKTIKKLKSKKTYYVRVRVTKGSSYKSSWSTVKKVKTK